MSCSGTCTTDLGAAHGWEFLVWSGIPEMSSATPVSLSRVGGSPSMARQCLIAAVTGVDIDGHHAGYRP
jgi:hypothetical protein